MEKIVYDICDKCNGRGFEWKFFRKQPCTYCNGTGTIHLSDFLADAAFMPEILAAKSEMKRQGFRTPMTFMGFRKEA